MTLLLQIAMMFLVAIVALGTVLAVVQIVKKLRGTAKEANSTALGWFVLVLSFLFVDLTDFAAVPVNVFSNMGAEIPKQRGLIVLGMVWWRWVGFVLIFLCGLWLLSGRRRSQPNSTEHSGPEDRPPE
jgi:hypothetical protein